MSSAPPESIADGRICAPFPGGDVIELRLLLATGQAAALEAAAWRLGLTAGQLARQVLRTFLTQGEEPPFSKDNQRGRK